VLYYFWSPAKPILDLYIQLKWVFARYYGVAYCLTTPVILSILILYYPRVNRAVLRFTAFPGLVFGIHPIVTTFYGASSIWNALLHVSLVITYIFALYLSMRKKRAKMKI